MSRVDTDPDYVALSHHQNSLKVMADRYPDGVPDHVAAKALERTEAQIRAMWATIVRVMRRRMGVAKGG